MSETAVQQRIRLAACRQGARLFRNNNGACKDENGRMVRYGLGNDSAQVNARLKSSDLIGITPVTVTPGMIGATHGIFTSIEVKRPGWTWRGTDREEAQARWLTLIISLGGIGRFMSGAEEWG